MIIAGGAAVRPSMCYFGMARNFRRRTAVDIAAWLRELGLERFEPVFRDNEIDWEVLPELTDADLEKLGLPLGPRKKLLKAIAGLSGKPTAVSTEVAPCPRPVAPEAERRQLTVLFCDLVGSTELSARLDPEDMSAVIRAYQSAVAGEITHFEGHVAKFMGDGVLAYFGYPKAHEDDAERAVRAGLALVGAVGGLVTPTSAPLAARIGIATGLVVVGELIGEGAAQEEAVVGETPNLAARLQAAASPGSVVISQATRRLVGGLFELDDLGPQRVKGFTEPLSAWRVLGEGPEEGRFEAMRGARLTPLVGRDEELHLLLARWRRAKRGEGQVVLLSGEPGIGKSRIVRALRERLEGESHTPLSHYCSPYHVNSALYPVIGLLERAAGFERNEAPEARLAKVEALLARGTERLDEAVPLISHLLGIEPGERYPALNLTPQRQKQRTLELLIDQVEGLAGRQPVLAVYEDAHWADPTTLELLGLMIERVRALPALVLLTFRPEFGPPWTGHAHVTQLSLSRLTRGHGSAMVERLVGGKELPGAVLEQVLARTDGVPLFVEELTKTVLESGLLRDVGDHFELAGPLAPLAIPASLQDSLMARLDRLAPVKEVAQIGAVIGREFSYELLAAVADRAEEELCAALDRLVSSELIFRRGTPPEAIYSFKHALVQDAAYQSLLKSRRQQLHARIARVLEERFPETTDTQPELIARHYTESLLSDRAATWWLRAGKLAASRSAHVEAIAHLRKSLDLLRTLPETPERARYQLTALLALGVSLQDVKGPGSDEVEEVYSRARRLCHEGSVFEEFAVVWGLWRVQNTRWDFNAAWRLADDLLDLAKGQEDPGFRLQAYHASWSTAQYTDDPEATLKFVRAGLKLYDARQRHTPLYLLSGHDPGVCGHGSSAEVTWLLGYPEQAVVIINDCLRLARELRHQSSLAHGLRSAIEFYLLCIDPDRLCALAEELSTLASEQGFMGHLATATFGRGWALVLQGHGEEGSVQMSDGAAMRHAAGFWYREAFYQALLHEAHRRAGSREGMEALSGEVSDANENDESGFADTVQIETARLRGELMLFLDPAQQTVAQDYFERAVDAARRRRAKSLELRATSSLARLWARRGDRRKGKELLAPVYSWFTEGFDTADLTEAKALLDELQ